MSNRTEREIGNISRLCGDLYTVEALYRGGERVVLGLAGNGSERAEKLLRERLRLAGYEHTLAVKESGRLELTVNTKRKLAIPKLNVVLFFVTLGAVYFFPVFIPKFLTMPDGLAFGATLEAFKRGAGIQFTVALMSILICHEMGHFLVGRRRGIVTSWPYFLPAPSLIGTFGAVIRSKSPFWNRRDLMAVGAAGPIAGWIVAIGWLVYGLTQSTIRMTTGFSPDEMGFSLEGESILTRFLIPLIIGRAPDGYAYLLTEGAFAGWVGLLITAINLLPIGQLDGGHIMYSIVRRRQKLLGWGTVLLLVGLGFQSTTWWVFAALGLAFGVAHPPTLDDEAPLDQRSKILGVAAVLILLLSFTPIPFR